MDNRRDFIKKAMLLSGSAGFAAFMPASVQRAFAIDPAPGSTFLDAEHVVILMQENRSFDHCFGTMQGVRGYNDPRAIDLPDRNKVWLQTNAAGETYAPFRLNIKDTKATWMGSLPHSRSSQVDAYNLGKFDKWLDAKRSSNDAYKDMPLTLGHYTREDIPFNYALADAFTVCDQNFSSAMTSTYPNRSFMWSGTIRERQDGESRAKIRNGNFKYNETLWKTFPERLEENGIAWKVYQNDLSCKSGFEGDERALLSNFNCNTLEFFKAFNVKYNPDYLSSLQRQAELLHAEINELRSKASVAGISADVRGKALKDISVKESVLAEARQEMARWRPSGFEKLPAKDKNLHSRAFTRNTGDPDFGKVATLKYMDENTEREVTAPKGDVLYQLREDVNTDRLPMVSWVVPPGRFSDHPSVPWYGAWYVSEVIDILTRNPEVWKKTIFIMTYDENDGYFDHIPPFTAPDPKNPETGKCSEGIDTSVDFISRELKEDLLGDGARNAPVGLGYRVPMIVASPWSRGGKVCSQVFDHTSSLQFLETFIGSKLGKNIRETNISPWRRAVCGDLTSAFSPYNPDKPPKLPFLKRDPHIEAIHKARFKKEPSAFKKLSKEEAEQINRDPASSPNMPQQDPGIRESCGVPYQLYAEGELSKDRKYFEIGLEAGNSAFGVRSAGAGFNIYTPGRMLNGPASPRSYGIAPGKTLTDSWSLNTFKDGNYHFQVHGPNGFLREFKGAQDDPALRVRCEYEPGKQNAPGLSGRIVLQLSNSDPARELLVSVRNNAYREINADKLLSKAGSAGDSARISIDPGKDYNWYDFSVRVNGFNLFEKRYAGRVETGLQGYTDPLMGRVKS